MSTLVGHIGPGTGFIIIGFYHFFRSLHTINFLRPFRNSKNIYLGFSIGLMITGILFAFVEWQNMPSWYVTHEDHFSMYLICLIGGIIDYLHKKSILKENFWCYFLPMGFFIISMIFLVHDQESQLQYWAHNLSAILTTMSTLAWIYSYVYITNLQIDKKSFTVSMEEGRKEQYVSEHIMEEGRKDQYVSEHMVLDVEGINPIYTNTIVYETIYPSFTGVTFILNGLWWWDMGFRLFSDNPEVVDHHASHRAVLLLVRYCLGMAVCLIVMTLIFQKIDRKSCNH